MSQKILVTIDGSTMEIAALIRTTIDSVYTEGDTLFLLRIQTPSSSSASSLSAESFTYDDALLRAASRECLAARVEHVAVLVQTDVHSVPRLLLEHCDAIDPMVIVLSLNRVSARSASGCVDAALRSGRNVLCVNFAPELSDKSFVAKSAIARASSASASSFSVFAE